MRVHAVAALEDYRAFRGTGMGSHNWVEVVRHDSLADAMDAVRANRMQVVAAHPGEDARDMAVERELTLVPAEKSERGAHDVAAVVGADEETVARVRQHAVADHQVLGLLDIDRRGVGGAARRCG